MTSDVTMSTARRDQRSRVTQWHEWYYLGFLVMLVFQPVFDPTAGPVTWWATAASVAAFVPLYLVTHARPGRVRRLAAPLSTLLAVAVFPFNGGATVLLVYAASFVGTYASREVALRWFAGLSLLTVAMAVVAPIPLPFAILVLGVPLFFIWLVGLASIDDVQRERETDRLRIDNARIGYLATAAERDRISRDLHDVLGQSLTEVIVRAQLVRRLASTDGDRAVTEASEIERTARQALDEVRAVVRGWREVRLEDELEVARRTLATADIELTVDRDERFDPPPTTESALALALREAVTNVVRHAEATRCVIALRRDGNQDKLQISDDGRGADIVAGSGLTGMRERILALGGGVAIESGDGTTVTIQVPAGLPA